MPAIRVTGLKTGPRLDRVGDREGVVLRADLPELEIDRPQPRLAIWRTLATLTLFYMAVALIATWPFVLSFKDTLTANGDPSQHLWIMNWNKACLLEWKSPFLCETLQYPVGAPLGLFSPLYLQSAMFVPLSLATHNDILSYNVIWLTGLVTTGLGVFILAWQVTGNRAASAIGGLLAMLSTPVMLHAHCHLELHFVGTIALFLAAWLKLLDRPGWGALAAAVACYVLMASAAAYYVVLMVVPTLWITAWRLVQLTRQGGKAALINRLKWLVGFGALTLPFVVLLLSNQVWALAHGSVMTRSQVEFTSIYSSSPLWGYFTPTAYHLLSPYLMPFDAYSAAGNTVGTPYGYFVNERASYLGIVTLLLIHYALIRRGGRRQVLLWWSLLAMLVVLGLGAYARLGTHRVSLPTFWLWKTFLPVRLLRTPARFNLLVVIPAAILAATGLSHLLKRMPGGLARGAVLAALSVVAIVDLALVPFVGTHRLPPLPASYVWLKQRDPGSTLFEWPINGPEMADRTYWQLFHGLPTSEGYSGVANMAFVHRINVLSPLFSTSREDFLSKPDAESYGPIRDVAFRDYAWLFFQVNKYRYVVFHDDLGPALGHPAAMARVRDQLIGAKVYEDGKTTIYEQSRLPVPSRPVLACTDGWRSSVGMLGPIRFAVGKVGRIELFNPSPGDALVLDLEASACRSARTVRLMAGPAELARWKIEPGEPKSYSSPPFLLPAGVQELTLESDAAESPKRSHDSMDEAKTPYSLRISAIRVRNDPRAANP
jgi:hypothetical protein